MSDIPEARVVKIGPAPECLEDDDTGEFQPSTAFDVSDENPKMLANSLRALQNEMRSGFEILNERLIPLFTRLEEKLDDLDVRVTRIERAQLDAELDRKRLAERVDRLESRKTKRPRRGK